MSAVQQQQQQQLLLKLVEYAVEGSCTDEATRQNAVERLYRYTQRILASAYAPQQAAGQERAALDSLRRVLLASNQPGPLLRAEQLLGQLSTTQLPAASRRSLVSLLAATASAASDHSIPGQSIALMSMPKAQQSMLPNSSLALPMSMMGAMPQQRISRPPLAPITSNENAQLATSPDEVPEQLLLRDAIYACIGVEGTYVKHKKDSSGAVSGFVIHGGQQLPAAKQQLLLKICELSWLSRRVRDAAGPEGGAGQAQGGPVRQAFRSALQGELTSLYHLVAVLEVQLQHKPPTADSSSEAASAPYLTLKRLAVWLREPILTLRLLASLADGVTGLGGGALVRQISVLAHHGDPFLRACLGRMLTAVSAPIVEMVRAWLFDGRLDMPPGEFFICQSPTAPGRAGALWTGGFRVEESMRPPFVSAVTAAKILRTGKSINFLRECCGDTEWLQSPGRAQLAAAAASLSCTQVAQLERLVDEAAADIDAHLLKTLFKRFNLAEHFAAMKRYLLLGQGDFIQALMDLVGSELGRPAGELSEYSLNGSLDAAVRASSAQYDSPDILDRLRLRLHRQLASDTGWDVFVLQYSVTEPLATVLSEGAMASYLRVFRLLWSLKRVEHALATTWQLLNSVQRQLSLLRAIQRQQGTSHHQGLASVWVELRAFHSVRTEMAHFCSSLQSYIVLEVLEACWGRFMDRLPHAANLEALIAAHSTFLEGLLKGALLGGSASAQTGDLQAELQAALRSVAQLPNPVGKLQELVAVAQMTTRARFELREKHIKAGEWGSSASLQPASVIDEEAVADIRSAVQRVNADFKQHQQAFIRLLQLQADVDLQFLLFRLDQSGESSAL